MRQDATLLLDAAVGAEKGRRCRIGDRFWIASTAKQFVSAAVLKCADAGLLTLEDTLRRFFPDAPADKAAITIRQLLSHTSGFAQSYVSERRADRASAVGAMLALRLEQAPGLGFEYSNCNYQLSAAIVEVVTRQGYKAFARRMWASAGMTRTGFAGPGAERVVSPARKQTPARHSRSEWGAEGVFSTTHDLDAWVRALRAGREISKAGLGALFAPVCDISEGKGALGWFIGRSPRGAERIFTRGNEDFGPNSLIYIYPATGTTIIVLTHAGDAPDGPSWSRRVHAALENALDL